MLGEKMAIIKEFHIINFAAWHILIAIACHYLSASKDKKLKQFI